jgi:hypothetical protein
MQPVRPNRLERLYRPFAGQHPRFWMVQRMPGSGWWGDDRNQPQSPTFRAERSRRRPHGWDLVGFHSGTVPTTNFRHVHALSRIGILGIHHDPDRLFKNR